MAERFRSVAQVRAEEQRLGELRDAERARLERARQAIADPGFRRALVRNGVRRALGAADWPRVAAGALLAWLADPERIERLGAAAGRALIHWGKRWRSRRAGRQR